MSQLLSPIEYNQALFARFDHDMKNNTLPKIPEPTQAKIAEYERSHRGHYFFLGNPDMNKLRVNESIPVKVSIWVDTVFNYYFDDLQPMLGLTHRCNSARKSLYKYKGYTWYTVSEINPGVMFD